MALRDIKKMKQGMSYTRKEKTIILNVFKYFRGEYPGQCVTEIVRKTAKATGCSEKSVFQFRKEEASPEGFREPSKTKIRKNININSRFIKYDNNVRGGIKNIVYELKNNNGFPSLNTILKKVNDTLSLPNFSLMTLRRLLFDMGFYYEKNGNKSVLMDKTVKSNCSFETKSDKAKDNASDNKPVVANDTGTAGETNLVCQSSEGHNSIANNKLQNQTYYQPIISHSQKPTFHSHSESTHSSHFHSVPMMFSHRIHPYAIHPPISSNADIHCKSEGPLFYQHPPHNAGMQ
ncbi:uncharacterized protein LOC132704451 [Cylas formicarius]|uniref:uncharacterized protein LOC132704451 n=1 Tax=Cylas formicarius TaxID=197179 RepID=UPI0029588D45|nr:uncharacterized protein LOC132704451 [Cylas formicarius]